LIQNYENPQSHKKASKPVESRQHKGEEQTGRRGTRNERRGTKMREMKIGEEENEPEEPNERTTTEISPNKKGVIASPRWSRLLHGAPTVPVFSNWFPLVSLPSVSPRHSPLSFRLIRSESTDSQGFDKWSKVKREAPIDSQIVCNTVSSGTVFVYNPRRYSLKR